MRRQRLLPGEHNKGRFFNLTKMTRLKHVAHDGWLEVNLFDTVTGTCQVLRMERPGVFRLILSGCFHVPEDTVKILEN